MVQIRADRLKLSERKATLVPSGKVSGSPAPHAWFVDATWGPRRRLPRDMRMDDTAVSVDTSGTGNFGDPMVVLLNVNPGDLSTDPNSGNVDV